MWKKDLILGIHFLKVGMGIIDNGDVDFYDILNLSKKSLRCGLYGHISHLRNVFFMKYTTAFSLDHPIE